jgi:hypothetical protein
LRYFARSKQFRGNSEPNYYCLDRLGPPIKREDRNKLEMGTKVGAKRENDAVSAETNLICGADE